MIAVYFKNCRTEFFSWAKTHLFGFTELYDLALLNESYKCLVTDSPEVPSDFHGKVISYGALSSLGVHIDDFDQLSQYIPIKAIVVPDKLVSTHMVDSIMDMAYHVLEKNQPPNLIVDIAPTVEISLGLHRVQAEVVPPQPSVRRADTVGFVQSSDEDDVDDDLLAGASKMDDLDPYEEQSQDFVEPAYQEAEPRMERPLQGQHDFYNDAPNWGAQHSQQFNQQAFQPAQRAYTPVQPTYPPAQSINSPEYQDIVRRQNQFGQTSLAPVQSVDLTTIRPRSMGVQRASQGQIRRSRNKVSNTSNIIFFYGISPKSGVSILTYMLATHLAQIHTDKQVLLLDMDVNQPDLSHMLASGYGLDPMSDANIKNLAVVPDEQLSEYLPALVQELHLETQTGEYVRLNAILNTGITFADKRALSAWDFRSKIQKLSEYYDYILVDCGRLQANANYQLMFLTTLCQKVFVCSGMNRGDLVEFVQSVGAMNVDYKVVLNRAAKNMTSATLTRSLCRDVLAIFPNIVSLESLVKRGKNAFQVQDSLYQRNLESLREGLGL